MQIKDDLIILDKTVAEQITSWRTSHGLPDVYAGYHVCSGKACSYFQIGDVFLCEKTGRAHGILYSIQMFCYYSEILPSFFIARNAQLFVFFPKCPRSTPKRAIICASWVIVWSMRFLFLSWMLTIHLKKIKKASGVIWSFPINSVICDVLLIENQYFCRLVLLKSLDISNNKISILPEEIGDATALVR